jgi:hypothetical protein
MLDGRPFFMRTAKLPGDPFESVDHRGALLGEIRRTVAAVQNQLGGQRVSTIVLFGAERGQDDLAKMLEEKFETPVHAFDPFAYVQRSAKLSARLPERSARFAPLLGLVIDELEERAPALDFLKPRQRPKPPSKRNRYASLAVAAAVLLVAYFVYGRLERAWLERDVANLDRQLTVVRKQAEEATKLEARVKEIERWTADDIVWLDELHLLSSNFPPAKEAMLTRLGMAAQGGVLNMKGLAEAEAIARFQAATRVPGRHVIESGSSRDTSQKHYGWNFAASIHVGPEAKK